MHTVTRSLDAMAPAHSPASAGAPSTDALKGWVVKATGVLLVVPALLNAGYDVYAAALKLPRTDAEKVNTEMFKKYFNKEPLAALPVSVKSQVGTVDARFAIYEGGEIYVEFGKHSQWFAFPMSDEPRKVSFSLIASANAQSLPRSAPSGQVGIASQKEVISGDSLIRSRIYTDGRTEQRKIDIRTGSTVSVDFGNVSKEGIPSQRSPAETIKLDPIDLRRLRASQQGR